MMGPITKADTQESTKLPTSFRRHALGWLGWLKHTGGSTVTDTTKTALAVEDAACACGLEDICDPTCFSHPDHPDNKDRMETKTGVPEVKLEPGCLARDILRAIARLKEWGLVP